MFSSTHQNKRSEKRPRRHANSNVLANQSMATLLILICESKVSESRAHGYLFLLLNRFRRYIAFLSRGHDVLQQGEKVFHRQERTKMQIRKETLVRQRTGRHEKKTVYSRRLQDAVKV